MLDQITGRRYSVSYSDPAALDLSFEMNEAGPVALFPRLFFFSFLEKQRRSSSTFEWKLLGAFLKKGRGDY